MALIGNNADTLLHGLSAFWHRFFRDIGDIQATYEGTEVLFGQVYLNFLSDVLNTSVIEAPLFRKEFYKLITIREDQLVYHEKGEELDDPPGLQFYGNRGANRYVYTSDTIFGAIPHLQDTIFAPATSLQEGVDYRVTGGELQLKVDPTNPVTPGYAQRRVVIAIGGKFSSATTTNWLAAGVEKGDTLYYSESTDLGIGTLLSAQDTARSATIIHVTAAHLTVSIDTPFPTFPVGAEPAGFSWRIMRKRDDGVYNPTLPRSLGGTAPFTDGQIVKVDGVGITTLEVSELSFWAVDAKIDDLTLYKTYGYFFTNPQLSTETYRSLIRGLMQLYILGPAMARLESALNLTAGLPTIRSEGEVLVSYDNGVLASGTTGALLINDVFQIPSPLFSTEAVGGFVVISDSDYYNNIGTFNIIEYISPYQVVLKPRLPFTPDTNLKWLFTLNNQQHVTTDQNVYEYPLNTPMRADVKDPANINILTFQAFESLTLAVQVTDYVQDPEWWHSITIPQELMPDTPASRRVVTPQLYPNILGPVGDGYVGDPGFYIGRDEESGNLAQGVTGKLLAGNFFEVTEPNTFNAASVGGYVQIYTAANPVNVGTFKILTFVNPTKVVLIPAGPFIPETLLAWGYFKGHLATKPYRHNAAFILMDRFLKLHMFAVLVDSSVSLTTILVSDLIKILKDVKPVHTALYFRPSTTFHDVINLTEADLGLKMVRRQDEELTTLENDLLIGSAWLIGDTWKFTNPVGGLVTTNPGSGGMFVAVGGADPSIQPVDPTNIPPGGLPDLSWLDRALYVENRLATNTLLTGLGAYWKMNSDSLDSLGVSNGVLDTDFSYTGGSFLGNPTGEPHIDLPNNAALDIYGDVSISVWINSGSGSPGYPYYNNNPIITYLNNLAGTGAYYLRTNPSGIVVFGPDSPGPILMTGNVFAADVWNHIVATRSGTTAKIYVNAVEVASGTVGAGASASGGLVQKIGATGVSEDIANRIKELGLWSRALTTTEISALYAGGAGLSYPF